MATQALSPSGEVSSTGGIVRDAAPRSLGALGLTGPNGFVSAGVTRPLSAATIANATGFLRAAPERLFSSSVPAFSKSGIASLLNLRVLSQPFFAYVTEDLSRASPLRRLSAGYQVFVPSPPPPPADTTPPAVGNFQPAPGTPVSRGTSIAFDVTEDSGNLQRVFVVAFFPTTGATEVIHDGDAFRGFYAASSARTMIAGGFRYNVLRTGGWPAAPTIQTFAIDRAGNEAS